MYDFVIVNTSVFGDWSWGESQALWVRAEYCDPDTLGMSKVAIHVIRLLVKIAGRIRMGSVL